MRRRIDLALYEAARVGGRVERLVLTGGDADDLAREMIASGADSPPTGYRGHAVHLATEGESRVEARVDDGGRPQGRTVRIAV